MMVTRTLWRKPRSRGSSPGHPRAAPASRGSDSSTASSDRLDQSGSHNHPVSPDDSINVCVRVRPLNNRELRSGDGSIIQFPGNGQILMGDIGSGNKSRVFSYNVVFEPGATQEDVLEFSGVKKLIEMALEGFSCTAFCYGQTGSGKTHTLTGPPGMFDRRVDPYSDNHGLVFRSFMYLFQLLRERSEFHFVLKASFLEIYNEKVIDLLNPGTARKPLAVRWSKKSRGFFVENLFTVDCEELDDLLAVLEEGMRNRSVGSHSMNDYSSRSHTILTVHIISEQQMEDGVFISKQGKINFVDLAGSEMTKKTHSEGKTLEEANNINKSLMVLGYCIASLSDSKKKNGHIPYRDSKLTKLLADSLAGNGVTLMIACISPARSSLSETINTLRYAARAKKIRTKPIVVMDPREALILSLKREVNALQEENDHLRTALNLHEARPPSNGSFKPTRSPSSPGGLVMKTPPTVDLDKLLEMESAELSELIKHYLTENEALRRENSELFTTRELLLRDQELVCRENERLLKKLEDVNSVCCRSPIIPARPTYSSEMLNMSINGDLESTNVWTNPLNASASMSQSTSSIMPGPKFKHDILEGRLSTKPPHRLPDSINKEIEKRGIGRSSMTNIADTYRERSYQRHNSWDNMNSTNLDGAESALRRKKIVDVVDHHGSESVPDLQLITSSPDIRPNTQSEKPRSSQTNVLATELNKNNFFTQVLLPKAMAFKNNSSSLIQKGNRTVKSSFSKKPASSNHSGTRSRQTKSSDNTISSSSHATRTESSKHRIQNVHSDSSLLKSDDEIHGLATNSRLTNSTVTLTSQRSLSSGASDQAMTKDPFGSIVSIYDPNEFVNALPKT